MVGRDMVIRRQMIRRWHLLWTKTDTITAHHLQEVASESVVLAHRRSARVIKHIWRTQTSYSTISCSAKIPSLERTVQSHRQTSNQTG